MGDSPRVIGGDYEPVANPGGEFPKRIQVMVSGEVTRWREDGSARTKDVFLVILCHEDGSVTWDIDQFRAQL